MSNLVLTAALILAGEVNVNNVTVDGLAAFIESAGIDVVAGKTKADTLNAICAALEDVADDEPDADDEDAAADVAGDPDVEGSNFLKRRTNQIQKGRGALGEVPSNMEEEAKKSSFIKRRLRKR